MLLQAIVRVSSGACLTFSSNHCILSNQLQSFTVKLLDKSLMRFAIVCLTVAAIVFLFHSLIHINPTTVGFIFLLAVLIVSAAWGLRYAVFLALISTLAYNFYFLPPVG